ncbi:MAG: ABC transporter permease subunit [Oscillospiraceae bacterium]|nr:ABC transporter permease subunit [Oscillospiraceae bacterium]
MKEATTLRKSRFSFGKAELTKLVLALVFVSMVFIPLIRMFSYMDADSIRRVVSSPVFGKAVLNSLTSALLGTVLTTVLALVLALCVERTRIPCKGIFAIIFVLPMLIPSISHGMGLVILLGNNGIISNLLGLDWNIYGLGGIVTGSVLYAFPVAYLMLSDVFHYEDGSAYEAARVLGIPKLRQFTAITLPFLKKPLISVVFSIFTLIITDYGVPLMVGGKYTTIATVMYQEVIGQLDFGKGAVYGTVLLIPAVIAFIADLMNKDKGKSGFVTKPCAVSKNKLLNLGALVFCVLIALMTLLPLVSFGLLAFTEDYPTNLTFTLDNVMKAFKLKAGTYYTNSVLIALGTAVVGTAIAFMTAYLSARMKSKLSRFLHLSSMTSAAIPGMVLGLSYVLVFKTTPIYGTVLVLILVNVVHFIASPYLMIYNSLSKINENLEGVAHAMGIKRACLIRDVLIPQCKYTLLEMFSYFFVNCMMTISAVSFLATTRNKPVSLMINQFEAQMQLECAAVISLMILGTNLIIKGIVHVIRKKHTA